MLPDRIAHKIDKALAMAKQLQARGRFADARQTCDLVLQLDPSNPRAYARLGLLALREGKAEEAIGHFGNALAARPQDIWTGRHLAVSYREAGQPDRAEHVLERMLRLQPYDPDLLLEMGRCRLDRGMPQEAQAFLERVAELAPENALGHSLLGVCQRRNGDRAGAAKSFRTALSLDAKDIVALNGMGNAALDSEDFDEAADYFRQAVALRPGFVKAQKNLAYALSLAGHIEPARAAFDHLLAMQPSYAEAHMDYGLFLLSIGEYRQGWEEYEQRWKFTKFTERDWSLGLPRWTGEPLEGRSLLLWGEQGIGDHILYGTMLPDVIRQADGQVTIAVEDRLVPLFARSFADAGVRVVARGAAADAQVQVPFASIGPWLRREPADCSDGIYLRADATRAAALRARYAALGRSGNRIAGLSWRSANWHIGNYKSLDLEKLVPVLRQPGITWVSLQYGDVSGELAALADRHGIVVHQDASIDAMRDLDGLAAQIAALDIVVSTSNSTVHFAGGLGIPCLVLLSAGRGQLWYWPREGERSPWYRSIRLIRQEQAGEWGSAIARLVEVLG